MYYDLNICNRLKKFYEDITETWEEWKEKPESPEIRIGTLGEPTGHPEFLDFLDKIKQCEYLTDGRILGTLGDPRRLDLLDKTLKYKSKVILLWSDTKYCKKAINSLKSSGINFKIGVKVEGDEKLKEFLDKVWEEKENYILIPEEGVSISPDDLIKDRKNIEMITYYQNILLADKKIIITKDSINLKPIKIYDRI